MIARLSYVMCDSCGTAAPAADDAEEARALARAEGFVRRDRRDLCRNCAIDPRSSSGGSPPLNKEPGGSP
jgi:hypothetical protein